MPRSSRIVIVSNTLPTRAANIHRNLEDRVAPVAENARDSLQDSLESGALPLQPDTHTTGEGLAVQSSAGSDFEERRNRARAAYLDNDSRYREAVREEVTPEAYTEQHFEDRAASQEPPLPVGSKTYAAILCLMMWGFLWEMGHQNVFTGKYEQRPWFAIFLLDWWAANAADKFRDLDS